MADIPNDRSYLINADQWSEDGYVTKNNRVYKYELDRKEQSYLLGSSWSIEEFLSDSDISADARSWLKGLLHG